uniref:Uncharacterized protein n=1 Tax=Anopheles albimanus TaxID=7167 RepID=A0A182FDH0_ANOAL
MRIEQSQQQTLYSFGSVRSSQALAQQQHQEGRQHFPPRNTKNKKKKKKKNITTTTTTTIVAVPRTECMSFVHSTQMGGGRWTESRNRKTERNGNGYRTSSACCCNASVHRASDPTSRCTSCQRSVGET